MRAEASVYLLCLGDKVMVSVLSAREQASDILQRKGNEQPMAIEIAMLSIQISACPIYLCSLASIGLENLRRSPSLQLTKVYIQTSLFLFIQSVTE